MSIRKKLINGPLNVVRLEGKINEIKKVIYIFFDNYFKIFKNSTYTCFLYKS